MTKVERRVFSREFKLSLVRRLLAGETALALAREHDVRRNLLYNWREKFRTGGAAALRLSGGQLRRGELVAPSQAAAAAAVSAAAALEQAQGRIAALEQIVGRQQVDLDFFRAALRHIREQRRTSETSGGAASTPSSPR
jgi:transposase-like protein